MDILKSTNYASVRRFLSFGMIAVLLFTLPVLVAARSNGGKRATPGKSSEREKPRLNSKGEISGEKVVGSDPVYQSSAEIAAQASSAKTAAQTLLETSFAVRFSAPVRSRLPQNPNAPAVSRFPAPGAAEKRQSFLSSELIPDAPQPVALSFTAATFIETNALPPDTMGAIGPSQFVAFVKGRLRSFTKAGATDGVLDVNPDVFFASVKTPVGGAVVQTLTAAPNIRFDRLSGRWILTMVDIPCTDVTCSTTTGNRIMVAVSDAASSAALTGATVWTFFQFQQDPTNLCLSASLGVDASALYVGCNVLTPAGSLAGTDGWVIPKSTILGAGPIVSWHFGGLVSGGTGAGPFAPRGVDNPDPNNTGPTATGYFIGVDNATFSTLMIRRVTDPSNTVSSPTISGNLSLTVPTTTFPARIPHLGNTGGTNGQLAGLDDRLFAAIIRNGRLWTAHNFRVNTSGVASTAAGNRVAIRWYEINMVPATPALVQSGTVFDNTATNPRQYWIPSITVSGQGHAALGASVAGTTFAANAFTIGRLSGDALGTMQGSPGSLAGYTSSSAAYNPPLDPGGANGRLWGETSFTSVDPLDDMTIWTINQYCDSTNSYGLRVAKLLAPPPASIANGPSAGLYNVPSGMASVNVTINGTSAGGSGFFDPGANLGGSAVPFNHISASISGTNVTVNSVTYNSPTSITLNLNTIGASVSNAELNPSSVRDLTITNPDGQSVTRSGIINILPPTAASVSISGRVLTSGGQGLARVSVTLTNGAGAVRSVRTNSFGVYRFDEVAAGEIYTLSVTSSRYQFPESSRILNVLETLSDQDFVAGGN